MIKEKAKAIMEYFKGTIIGMMGDEKELTVALKDKEVTIKEPYSKSIEEIIKEIESAG